jgi:hypothetical protein
MKPYMWIWPIILLALGILSPILGIVGYNRDTKFAATAEHATATIIEYVPDPDPKASGFCPRYEFTTAAGEHVTYTGDDCASEPDKSRIGQTQEAYYDPENPQSIYDKPDPYLNLIFGAIGALVFPLLGAASLGYQYWQVRRKQNRR